MRRPVSAEAAAIAASASSETHCGPTGQYWIEKPACSNCGHLLDRAQIVVDRHARHRPALEPRAERRRRFEECRRVAVDQGVAVGVGSGEGDPDADVAGGTRDLAAFGRQVRPAFCGVWLWLVLATPPSAIRAKATAARSIGRQLRLARQRQQPAFQRIVDRAEGEGAKPAAMVMGVGRRRHDDGAVGRPVGRLDPRDPPVLRSRSARAPPVPPSRRCASASIVSMLTRFPILLRPIPGDHAAMLSPAASPRHAPRVRVPPSRRRPAGRRR